MLIMFPSSAGISLVSSSGTFRSARGGGSQAGSTRMVAPPGNQLSTGILGLRFRSEALNGFDIP